MLYAYQYNDAWSYTRVTSTLTAAKPIWDSPNPSPYASYPETRTNRTYVNSNGQTLLAANALIVGVDEESSDWVNKNGFHYDARGRLQQTVNPYGETTTYAFDITETGTGLPKSVSKPHNEFYAFRYDSVGNLLELASTAQFSSDDRIHVSATYDKLSRVTEKRTDIDDFTETGEIESAPKVVVREWEYEGQTHKRRNRNEQWVTTNVDVANKKRTETAAYDGTTYTVEYDNHSDGSLKKASQTIVRPPENPGEDPVTETSTVELAYDQFGRQIRDVQNASFDEATLPKAKIELAWFDNGSLKKIVRKLGSTEDRVSETSYTVDGLGWTTSTNDVFHASANTWWYGSEEGNNKLVTYAYNADGQMADLHRHAGLSDAGDSRGYTGYSYSRVGERTGTTHLQAEGLTQKISNFSTVVTDLSERKEKHTESIYLSDGTTPFRSYETTNEYFPNGKLSKVTIDLDESHGVNPLSSEYSSDPTGNNTQFSDGVVNRDNRIFEESKSTSEVSGGVSSSRNETWTHTYDDEGQVTQTIHKLITSVGAAGGGGGTQDQNTLNYKWDHRGRLEEIETIKYVSTHANGSTTFESTTTATVRYFYDALDRRIGRTEYHDEDPQLDRTYAYIYDPSGMAIELLVTSSGSDVYRHYHNGPQSLSIVAVDQATPSGGQTNLGTTTAWIFTDQSGSASTVASVSDSGVWHYYVRTFKPFGEVDATGGNEDPALTEIPAIWRGLTIDPTTEHYLAGTTAVHTLTGRLISQAAVGNSNPYYFVGERPGDSKPIEATDEPFRFTFSGVGHGVLDVLGLIPGWGNAFDAANAAWYLKEGNTEFAALSGAAAVPGLGYAATAAKYGARGVKLARAGRTARLGLAGAFAHRSEVAVTLGLSLYAVDSGIRHGSFLQAGLGAVGLGFGGRQLSKGLNKTLTHGTAELSTIARARKISDNAFRQATLRQAECFVAGTLVYIPIDPDDRLAFALAAGSVTDIATGAGWRLPVGVSAVAAGVAACAASEIVAAKSRRKEDELDPDRRRSRTVDHVFGKDDWLDPVEMLWGEGVFDPSDTSFARSIESAADEIADDLASILGNRGRPRFA